MTQKQKAKNKTNSDILTAGSKVEIITEYSVDECMSRLHALAKGEWSDNEQIKVKTKTSGDQQTRFKITRAIGRNKKKRRSRIKGTLQPQEDGNTLIQAGVPQSSSGIALSLAFITIIFFLFIKFVLGFDSPIFLGIMFVFVALSLVSAFSGNTVESDEELQALLLDALYTPPETGRKQKHE